MSKDKWANDLRHVEERIESAQAHSTDYAIKNVLADAQDRLDKVIGEMDEEL